MKILCNITKATSAEIYAKIFIITFLRESQFSYTSQAADVFFFFFTRVLIFIAMKSEVFSTKKNVVMYNNGMRRDGKKHFSRGWSEAASRI